MSWAIAWQVGELTFWAIAWRHVFVLRLMRLGIRRRKKKAANTNLTINIFLTGARVHFYGDFSLPDPQPADVAIEEGMEAAGSPNDSLVVEPSAKEEPSALETDSVTIPAEITAPENADEMGSI